MNIGNGIFALLTKAEKWFYVKKDFNYCFLYIMFVIEQLARVETMMRGKYRSGKPSIKLGRIIPISLMRCLRI